jgi:hypothetical protein
MAGHVKSQCQHQGWSLRLASRLDHMKTLPKRSSSSKRAAVDQGGLGAVSSGQGRKEGKYTLDAMLDQPCKFHSTPGWEATQSTHQCRFMRELEQHAQQLPGAS